jgi:hypothetical protein
MPALFQLFDDSMSVSRGSVNIRKVGTRGIVVPAGLMHELRNNSALQFQLLSEGEFLLLNYEVYGTADLLRIRAL